MEKMTAKFGDYVEVHLTKLIYEGVLLESSEKNVLLLKLDSGYNIGFNRENISKVVVLKKAKEVKDDFEISFDKAKPNIAMIITGGTISSRYDSKTGGVKPLDTPESLFKFYPELFEKVNVVKVEIPFMKFSENMDPKDWKKIAKVCEKLLNDSNIKGVVITHGTDFLHYTASALSFFLGKLNKPVILTYSQRSIDRASSDANLNLICSAEIAGLSDLAEVVLVGHANSNDEFCYAMPGTKVRKLHSSRRDAFRVVNDKPIAKVYPNKVEFLKGYNQRNKNNVKSDVQFEEKVALVKFYPGQDSNILDFYLEKGYKGIVLELSGLGHCATSGSRNSWVAKIKKLVKKGVVICGVSQCINGAVDPYVYSAGRDLINAGIVYLEDMLAETAFVKLGWVLGHAELAKNKKLVKEKMIENISGEFNNRIEV